MLEKQTGGVGRIILAAVSAFQLVTADIKQAVAATPKEFEQTVPKAGFKEFLDKDKVVLKMLLKSSEAFSEKLTKRFLG